MLFDAPSIVMIVLLLAGSTVAWILGWSARKSQEQLENLLEARRMAREAQEGVEGDHI